MEYTREHFHRYGCTTSFPSRVIRAMPRSEMRTRYCTVRGSHNTNVRKKREEIVFLLCHRILSFFLSASFDLVPSLARTSIVSPLFASPPERERREANHHHQSLIDWSIPSSRGWDGLHDRSAIRPFLSVVYDVSYVCWRTRWSCYSGRWAKSSGKRYIHQDLLLLRCYLVD
jgi:hypothetical protein